MAPSRSEAAVSRASSSVGYHRRYDGCPARDAARPAFAGRPRIATARKLSPSARVRSPCAAPHKVCAFSRIAAKTGARSPGEELMTCNTSAVAVSSLQRLVTLGFALGKLTLHIGDKLLGIGYRAVGRRTHLRTFVGTD